MTVCIIDDNPVAATQLARLLKSADLGSSQAFTDARRALQWCIAFPPSLVLLDYHMPELNGLEILGRLRANAATRHVPVAMISGWVVGSLRVEALQAGACDVIAKPFVPDELKLKVRNLLNAVTHAAQVQSGVASDGSGPDARGELHRHHDHPDRQTIELLTRITAFRRDRDPASLHRMARYAACIARHCGMGAQDQALILRAAPLMHLADLSVPDDVLLRRRPLIEADHRLLADRPAIGEALLQGFTSPVLRMASDLVRCAQEHWDGSGRPRGLRGEEIPLAARVVTLADMFEQMTSGALPGARSISVESAAAVIRADDGCHFDPAVVHAFGQALPEIGLLMRL